MLLNDEYLMQILLLLLLILLSLQTPGVDALYLLHGTGDVMTFGGIVKSCHRDVEGPGSRLDA